MSDDDNQENQVSSLRPPLKPSRRKILEMKTFADSTMICKESNSGSGRNKKTKRKRLEEKLWPNKNKETREEKLNEADTCRKYVTPKLVASGWDDLPHIIKEQHQLTDGRITIFGGTTTRGDKYRADYLLNYHRDFPIAVVEAKPEKAPVAEGMQQAKNYAEILNLKFAYATNGHEILEFDFLTGIETRIEDYPKPEELLERLSNHQKLDDKSKDILLTPYNLVGSAHTPRYYQTIAINNTIESILKGKKKNLITMATGTGKTVVAFQICWKLWTAKWNRTGEYRKPRILFLADRNVLVDDPKDKTFTPFGDARYKIEGGKISTSREMYFAIYQSLSKDKNRPGLYKEFSRDFFDLIIIDECHRGSARDDSNWREILEYFDPAYQLGMTATPLEEDNKDTYDYFKNPIYTYSLARGIADGFLAPYRVHRIVTSVDAAGWRPTTGELDRYGKEIPDGEYGTKDFERKIVLKARTDVIAKHITAFLKRTDRFAKTIVFCVDQSHANEMRQALSNLNSDLVIKYPNYVARVTSDEKKIGKGHLSRFQDLETISPVILTTSQLLTTGVDAPTCKNIILVRVVNSMSEFKQIIGRGTRLREDYGKLWFSILDYTGSATKNFADETFDGFPEFEEDIIIDDNGGEIVVEGEDDIPETPEPPQPPEKPELPEAAEKYYIDVGSATIDTQVIYDIDEDGKQIRAVQFTDYTAHNIRTLFSSRDDLKNSWADPLKREDIISTLKEKGIEFSKLSVEVGKPDADPFDLLCYLAFDTPLRTRRERAEYLKKNNPDFFDLYGEEAKQVLEDLLVKYTGYGPEQLNISKVADVPPISNYGNIIEIANRFGGPSEMKHAVDKLQYLLYN